MIVTTGHSNLAVAEVDKNNNHRDFNGYYSADRGHHNQSYAQCFAALS